MTVHLPRRFVLAAVSAAVLALVAGLLLLSDPGGDGDAAALTAGALPTLVPMPSTSFPAPRDQPPTATAPTVVAVAPTAEAPEATATEPATTPTAPAAPTDTTRRRSAAAPSSTEAPPAPAPPTTPTTTPPSTTILTVPPVRGSDEALAAAVVAAHNEDRAARGLAPLQQSACLDRIAASWAAHLASIGDLVHNPGAPVATGGCVAWRTVGENLGYDGSIVDLEQAWMSSEVHEANILDPAFTLVGVGVARRGNLLYVVVNFAG